MQNKLKLVCLLLALLKFTAVCSQVDCVWRDKEVIEEYQPKYPISRSKKINFNVSEEIWDSIKNEDYTFLVVGDGGMTDLFRYTQIEVKRGEVFSRKFKSVRMEVSDHKYSCQPNWEKCPMKLKVDSLKANNCDYKELLFEHVSTHTILVYRDEDILDCWEEFEDDLGSHEDEFVAFPAITLDSVYLAYEKYLSPKVQLSYKVEHQITVNKEGIVSEIPAELFWYYEHPKEMLMDYFGPPKFYLNEIY